MTVVSPDEECCPGCGRLFRAVKCPNCSYSGEGEEFRKGCPVCGYLSDSLPEKNSSPLEAESEIKQRKRKKLSSRLLYGATALLLILLILQIVKILTL